MKQKSGRAAAQCKSEGNGECIEFKSNSPTFELALCAMNIYENNFGAFFPASVSLFACQQFCSFVFDAHFGDCACRASDAAAANNFPFRAASRLAVRRRLVIFLAFFRAAFAVFPDVTMRNVYKPMRIGLDRFVIPTKLTQPARASRPLVAPLLYLLRGSNSSRNQSHTYLCVRIFIRVWTCLKSLHHSPSAAFVCIPMAIPKQPISIEGPRTGAAECLRHHGANTGRR